MQLENLPPIKDILNKYNLGPKKKFGQNFLHDINITNKIVSKAGILTDKTIIEIGPGPGLLTRSILLAKPKKLYAIDVDPNCINALNDYLLPHYQDTLELINSDAMNCDIFNKLNTAIIIANLPYNISTELLFFWLSKINNFTKLVLMFQKEVADRICAQPRTKAYGRLSIKSQLLCRIDKEFDISASAFYPPPKITSTVISLTPYTNPNLPKDLDLLEKICKISFGKRRKTLRSSLKTIFKDKKTLYEACPIDLNKRPEELNINDFCNLSDFISNQPYKTTLNSQP